ncbi:MAG: hypothetical protein GF398_21935 [Chitinivibrionales bacterium]|nr:hypothetical protein [Chitinivibrionales bacterium]
MFLTRRTFVKYVVALIGKFVTVLCGVTACRRSRLSPRQPSSGKAARSYRRICTREEANDPAYIHLWCNGELQARTQYLWDQLSACRLCPNRCATNRHIGRKGRCKADHEMVIHTMYPVYAAHQTWPAQPPSALITFSNCPLSCVFCKNWDASQKSVGKIYGLTESAIALLHLQNIGCSSVRLNMPTPYLPHILSALSIAIENGFRLPLHYRTSGYENAEVLSLLAGIVDVYQCNLLIADSAGAQELMGPCPQYPAVLHRALMEMHRQTGPSLFTPAGKLRRGISFEHTVLPQNTARGELHLKWLRKHIGTNMPLRLNGTYQPAYQAINHPAIARRVHSHELSRLVQTAKQLGFSNVSVDGT